MGGTPITKRELVATNIACLTITSLFVAGRVAIQAKNRKRLQPTDYFIYAAYVLYLALWLCYFMVTPPVFRVYSVSSGQSKPYAGLLDDSILMQRLITAAQFCFYTLLYSVKLSLLALYRHLLHGLPARYRQIWVAIVVACVLSWVGSVISMFVTCSSLHAQFVLGKCGRTPREIHRIAMSLYLSYALDALTDLMVMGLPIRLTWGLQMGLRQRVGLSMLFGSGVVCVVFATLRVVKVGVEPNRDRGSPEPKWLIFFTMLEVSIAVIVGCCPAFAVLIRSHIKTKKASSYGYGQHSGNRDGGGGGGGSSGAFKMQSMISAGPRKERDRKSRAYWDDANSSQEELAKSDGGDMRIYVTTNIEQDEGRPVGREGRDGVV